MLRKFLVTFLLTLLFLSLFSTNTIEVTAAAETHDIIVVSVTPSPTEVEKGDLVNITVVVSNRGTESETFNITTYYATNASIETKSVLNLAPNTNATLFFDWNTTDVSTGIYTIKAKADHLPGEMITEDNTLVSRFRVRVYVSPHIAVVPGSTMDETLTPGMNYTVSVYTDYTGKDDVLGYELDLTFNPNVLEGLEVVNGDLITDETLWIPGTFNNTGGYLSLTLNAFWAEPPAPLPVTSGPGTLVNITFAVVGQGDSYITFRDQTRLIGYDTILDIKYNIIEPPPPYDHVSEGYFSNLEEIIHDIAIISVTPSSTGVEVGDFVNITVVVENEGTVTEDVTIKVYRDYAVARRLIDTKTVQDLQAGAVESLIFTWDTTGTQLGNHTITAKTDPPFLLGETDTADNLLQSDEMVEVRAPEEQPIPIDLIIGIVIIAFVTVAVVYAYRRRRKH